MANAERLGALAQELAVAAHPLGVDRAHVEHLLGLPRSRRRARSPSRSRARSASPASTALGGPEAGAGVDHRRPADRPADRGRDRRAALGDRQPAVAVERRQRGQRLLRIAAAVQVGARLEHHHLEPGLGQERRGDRAAGARADDRHVALLAAGRAGAGRRGPGRRSVGSRSRPSVDLAAHLVADRGANPRVVAVARAREDLQEQQQVAGEREARALEPAQEVLPRLEAGAAEPPREGQPARATRRASLTCRTLRLRQARQVAVERLRDLDRVGVGRAPVRRARRPAAGPRSRAPSPRRRRAGSRAARRPLRSPGGGAFRRGRRAPRSGRPPTTAAARRPTRKPSTRKLSR